MENTQNNNNSNTDNTNGDDTNNSGNYTENYNNFGYGGYGDYGNFCGGHGDNGTVTPEKKGVSLWTLAVVILLTAVITFQITFLAFRFGIFGKTEEAIPSYFDTALTIDEYLKEYYIGKMDEELLEQALAAALLYASGDAHARYYTPEEFKAMSSSLEGNSIGVGVMISYRADNYVEISRVYEGSPADDAGIKNGDVIVSIDGKDLVELGAEGLSDAIRGESGTEVTFKIMRGDEFMDITVTRRQYTVQTVVAHMYKDGATEKKIGVLQIYDFNDVTAEQFKIKLNGLIDEGAEALIFDLRDNTGGTIDSVVEMLDMLLPEGKIARITDKNGDVVRTYVSDAECVDLPMAVLTNGLTASAAELFTAALKDYNKAVSVGTRTYGKGTMQVVVPLPDGGAFKFSYMYYSPPISDNYNDVGIFPDIEVEVDTDIYHLNDENDDQLKAAVQYILNGN